MQKLLAFDEMASPDLPRPSMSLTMKDQCRSVLLPLKRPEVNEKGEAEQPPTNMTNSYLQVAMQVADFIEVKISRYRESHKHAFSSCELK